MHLLYNEKKKNVDNNIINPLNNNINNSLNNNTFIYWIRHANSCSNDIDLTNEHLQNQQKNILYKFANNFTEKYTLYLKKLYQPALTYLGISQSILLGCNTFKYKNYIHPLSKINSNNLIDIENIQIYCSPSVRTLMTAMLSLRSINLQKKIKIIICPFIIENKNTIAKIQKKINLNDNDAQNDIIEKNSLINVVNYITDWLNNDFKNKNIDYEIFEILKEITNILNKIDLKYGSLDDLSYIKNNLLELINVYNNYNPSLYIIKYIYYFIKKNIILINPNLDSILSINNIYNSYNSYNRFEYIYDNIEKNQELDIPYKIKSLYINEKFLKSLNNVDLIKLTRLIIELKKFLFESKDNYNLYNYDIMYWDVDDPLNTFNQFLNDYIQNYKNKNKNEKYNLLNRQIDLNLFYNFIYSKYNNYHNNIICFSHGAKIKTFFNIREDLKKINNKDSMRNTQILKTPFIIDKYNKSNNVEFVEDYYKYIILPNKIEGKLFTLIDKNINIYNKICGSIGYFTENKGLVKDIYNILQENNTDNLFLGGEMNKNKYYKYIKLR